VGLRHQDVEFRCNTSIASCTYPTSIEYSVVTLRLILCRCIDTPDCWVSIANFQHIFCIQRCAGGLHIKQKVLLGNLKREVFEFCEDSVQFENPADVRNSFMNWSYWLKLIWSFLSLGIYPLCLLVNSYRHFEGPSCCFLQDQGVQEGFCGVDCMNTNLVFSHLCLRHPIYILCLAYRIEVMFFKYTYPSQCHPNS
jgi:hypothetical protein